MEDTKIVALFFDQNKNALSEPDKKYKHDCYKIAANILMAREDVEECVSDSYLAVWQSIPPNKQKTPHPFTVTLQFDGKHLQDLSK